MSSRDKDMPPASKTAGDPAGDGETGFLSRWSQRKRAVREERERDDALKAEPSAEEIEKASEEARIREENRLAAEAVDLETLTFESDYSVFLKDGVSKHLKNMALRKLWQSNPVLACVDGLNDYDEDFRTVETLTGGLKTSWQVGKGYGWMDELDKAEETASAEGVAGTPSPEDAATRASGGEAANADGDASEPGDAEKVAATNETAQGDEAEGDREPSAPEAGSTRLEPVLETGEQDASDLREKEAASLAPPARPARKRMRFS